MHTAVKGMLLCRQGRRDFSDLFVDARIDARGRPYYWLGERRREGKPKRNTDLSAVDSGAIAITPLQLDLTAQSALRSLRAALT